MCEERGQKFIMSVFQRMLNTQALMFIYVVTGIIMAKTKILKHDIMHIERGKGVSEETLGRLCLFLCL